MRVLTFYINAESYRDRILMLREAAPLVGHIEVLLGHGSAQTAAEFSTAHLTVTPLSEQPQSGALRDAAIWRETMARVKKGDIDLVHDTATFMVAVFARLRLMKRRPRLMTSTFAALHEWREDLRQRFPYDSPLYIRTRRNAYWREKAIVKMADAATVFGEGHIERFARMHDVDPAKVHSLPNCCDPEAFGPRAPEVAATGFPEGSRVLAYVGNLFIYKGTWELIRAFAAISRRFDDARLLLVGRIHSEEMPGLGQEPERVGVADKVRFLGTCERGRLPVLLSSSDAFVFPSYTEGSPRAVIEAMACGLPVIATSLPGMVTLDPKAEFTRFVPWADAAELARALEAHLSAPQPELQRRRAASRARFLAHHTPAAAARPLAALYQTLVGTK